MEESIGLEPNTKGAMSLANSGEHHVPITFQIMWRKAEESNPTPEGAHCFRDSLQDPLGIAFHLYFWWGILESNQSRKNPSL